MADLNDAKSFLAQAVFQRRTAAGLTQIDLSKQAKLSKSLISNIERKMANPNLDTLLKLARALNVPLADLLDYKTDLPNADKSKEQIGANLVFLDKKQLHILLDVILHMRR